MRTIIKQKRCNSVTLWLWKERHTLYNDYKNIAVKIDTIWDKLPQDIKNELAEQLLKEQGYICCYCGQRIDRNTMAIEHFNPKSIYRNEIFDYANLFASCKCSDKKYYPYDTEINQPQNVDSKAIETLKISHAKSIVANKMGKTLEEVVLDDLDKNYARWNKGNNIACLNPNPPNYKHCDDKKDDKDPKIGEHFILNPQITNIEQYFVYDEHGKITVNHTIENVNNNIGNIVLHLNVSKLCKKRYEVYQKAKKIKDYLKTQLDGGKMNVNQVRQHILAINPTEVNENKPLNEFCFVEQFALKKLFGIK
jgi:uncharacterized protein (TIGR02646 family)